MSPVIKPLPASLAVI